MKAATWAIVFGTLAGVTACSSNDRPDASVGHQGARSPETATTGASTAGETPATGVAPVTNRTFTSRPDKPKTPAVPVREPPPVVDLPDVPGRHDAVVLFPDGNRLAACGDDGVVQVFALESKQPLLSFEGVPGEPRLAVSNNGMLIAQGSRSDTRIKLWNFEKKSEVGTLQGHEHPISDLAFSPDSSQFAASSSSAEFQGSIRIWNLSAGSNPAVLNSGGVISIDFSPDGTHLASAATYASAENGPSSKVSVWDLRTAKEAVTVPNKCGPTFRVLFSPDGTTLAIAERNGPRPLQSSDRIRLVDPRTGQERGILLGHAGEIDGLAFSRDSQLLLSSGQDSKLRVWQVPTKSLRSVQELSGCGFDRITLSSDGGRFAIASGNGAKTVHPTVWNFDQALRREPRYRGEVPAAVQMMTEKNGRQIATMAFSSDGQRLATSNNSGQSQVYDARSGARLAGTEESAFVASAFSPNLENVVMLSETLQIRELRPGGAVRELGDQVNEPLSEKETLPNGVTRTWTGTSRAIHALAVSTDGHFLATAHSHHPLIERTLKLRNLETAELVAVAAIPDSLQNCCAFSSDGRRLVTGGGTMFSEQHGPVYIFDLKNFANPNDSKNQSDGLVNWPSDRKYANVPAIRQLHELFHGVTVVDIAVSHDASRVASVGNNGTVKIWDVGTEQVVATCSGLLAEFSPDDKMLATAEIQDKTPVIVLRDALTCKELRTLQGMHFLGISALAFSPDGKRLASGGRDGMVIIWDTSTGKPD